MSETLDVNVLVHARDQLSPHFHACAAVVDRLGQGPEVAYLMWPVLVGFLRVSTNPRAMADPLTARQAQARITELLDRPNIKVVGPGDRYWVNYLRAAEGVDPVGNLVSDAHLVALMYEHGIGTIWTRDRDFRKFDGIRVRDPLKP